ncbi:hypothetical protein BLNAU_19393 [Blattamonas nauphoetae]|uniref:Uncharacterized protein n=1 Tax=Blattamonas nauphoetae TaxID=2049346 RepID=A0ABQ9X1L7_9EUKA|nr:hypothetical protein BLNAU_19393 [Blattamonas nauphoetae]
MLKTLWLVSITIAAHGATHLSEIIDCHLDRDHVNNELNNDVLRLSPGVFQLLDYPVISKMLKLEGTTSTITQSGHERTPVINQLKTNKSQHPNHSPKAHMDASHSLFMFDNSTVSLNKLIFDCGSDGMALAKVKSSEVVVSSSKVISNLKQTAFVVGTGMDGVGSSISVIDCSFISSSSMVLLPLVRTSPCLPTPPRDSSSTDTPHSDNTSPFLSVRGAGLVLSNVDLILGTGPLLDFGLLSHRSSRSGEIGGGETSTFLVGSVLRNVTSRGCSPEQLGHPSGLSQKLIGTEVTLSTSHLDGTGCLDINTFGSVYCVNTTFSHCSSNAESSPIAHQHFSSGDRFVSSQTAPLSLSFRLCTFTSMTSRSNGSQLDRPRKPVDLTLLFVDCVATDYGAALHDSSSSRLSIARCFFRGMTTSAQSAYSGAVDCVFMECVVTHARGYGGCLYLRNSALEMASVQFIDNSAPSGSDVYLSSGCGSLAEVMGRISDCHTNTFSTSLMSYDFGVRKGIIEEAGPATTITSIGLSLSYTVFAGSVKVETEESVEGKMLLLLDNTDAYTPITESSPPAACRVVVVEFPTLTKTGTSTVLPIGDNARLQFLSTYRVIAASLPGTPIDVSSSPPIFTISDAPRVLKILCRQGPNIGEKMVSLEGRYLAVGKYTVTFEGSPGLTLDVSFAEDQKGKQTQYSSSVSVGPGGTDKRFALGETYKVEKITSNYNPVRVESQEFSLVVPPLQSPFVFEVNKKKGGDDGNCRGLDNSCASFDAAFEMATKMKIKSFELKLVVSDTISKTLSISDEEEVFVTQGGLVRPSLIVPSTFSSNPLVVLSVSNASLSLTDTDALIRSSSLDLKLFQISSGSFEFSNGVIASETSSTANSEIRATNSDLCSWTTGAIEIVNSTAVFKSCSLTNLTQGAIIQSGGNVSLRDVYFLSNGPTHNDFPSARRNVMCSEGGTLFVGGLTGDGRSHHFPGSGISAETCHVSGATTKMSIPFVDSTHSTITRDKKTGNFKMDLVGSGFIPCGLKLEVFTLLEDGTEEVSDALIVDTKTASLFTETEIVFIVTPKDIANLSKNSDWKVRLLNGDRFVASQSLVLREKPTSMLWLIPVIVVVVVVIAGVIVALLLIWKCCSKKPVEKKEEMTETVDKVTLTTKDSGVDQPENESSVEQAVNVSDMSSKSDAENNQEPDSSPETKIDE